jgi:hypothetical protein
MHAVAARRSVAVDFRGAFYVPAVDARASPAARNSLAAALVTPSTPEATEPDSRSEFPGAIIDPETAQEWLVVNPCTLLVR